MPIHRPVSPSSGAYRDIRYAVGIRTAHMPMRLTMKASFVCRAPRRIPVPIWLTA
ncbi:MAG TPA: hypothetical protein PK438_06875 [Clostridia bacterium]|nr:hypothetical protein [Clostridia bacterium]